MTIVTVAPVDDKNISQMEKKTLNYIRLVPIRKSQLFVLICGRRKKIIIGNIYKRHNIQCVCGDKMSYPNKFLFSFFEQLGANFTPEKTFDWSENRRYDDYIILPNGETLICENHGGFQLL